MKTVENNPKDRPFSIGAICNGFSQKRDAYYKYKKRYVARKKSRKPWSALWRKAEGPSPGKEPENS